MSNLPAVQQPAYPMDAIERMAERMVKSRLFGVENIDQAVALMLVAQADGLHPAVAARDYHVIQGRPTLKADAMMARFQQAGGRVEWQDYTDLKVSGLFSHPQSPKPVLIEWTLEQAKRIGLANKDNWRKYPRQMLRARVISEGVRTTYPAIATGVYTPDEVQDFEPQAPSTGSLSALTGKQQDVVAETASQIRQHMAADQAWGAYQLLESLEGEERLAIWSMLDSKIRSALKRMQDAESSKDVGIISEAQHKRLEARIRELKLNRDDIKQYCKDNFNKDHFPALSQDEYQDVDRFLDAHAPKPSAPAPAQEISTPSGSSVTSQGDGRGAGDLLTLGKEASEWGTQHYAAWWEALTPEQRKVIGKGQHEAWKAIAQNVPA
jgi:hypothetical protein